MRPTLFMIVLVLGSLVCFIGYCAALIDWVQDVRTGVYYRHQLEAILETSGLVGYTYLGIRFINARPPIL